MKEIFPNLWLGSLLSVSEIKATVTAPIIVPTQKNAEFSCMDRHIHPSLMITRRNEVIHHWTVISILDSPKLINLVQSILQQLIEENRCTHVVWKLPDTSQAPFLSTMLSSILHTIDEGLGHHQNNNSNNNNNNKACCLIHCAKGISRSVATCAAWLISRRHCQTIQEAMELIRLKTNNAVISPNMGLLASLRAIEQCQGNVIDAMARIKSSEQ
jgi:Dual specificity phosphatase, catalytic domain